jgi:hypothetical protein
LQSDENGEYQTVELTE